jgi:hypothetical protein
MVRHSGKQGGWGRDTVEDFPVCGRPPEEELCRNSMNLKYLLCLISIILVTGCTDVPPTGAVATVPVPTPTPENFGLYTDSDLQIYADSLDLKIQQALKDNNSSQAQDLGIKRQALIAEFSRRNLKRSSPAVHVRPHYSHLAHPVKSSGNAPSPASSPRSGSGLPGQD